MHWVNAAVLTGWPWTRGYTGACIVCIIHMNNIQPLLLHTADYTYVRTVHTIDAHTHSAYVQVVSCGINPPMWLCIQLISSSFCLLFSSYPSSLPWRKVLNTYAPSLLATMPAPVRRGGRCVHVCLLQDYLHMRCLSYVLLVPLTTATTE